MSEAQAGLQAQGVSYRHRGGIAGTGVGLQAQGQDVRHRGRVSGKLQGYVTGTVRAEPRQVYRGRSYSDKGGVKGLGLWAQGHGYRDKGGRGGVTARGKGLQKHP